MAYATYTTRAVVCGAKDSYTSDRAYLLFTEEAGMLWAKARSVRLEKSKQRYGLQDFSLIRVSLVKGKTGWKIGSTEAIKNPFLAARSRSERALATFVVRQLRRYLQGEEPVRPVFGDVWSLLSDITILGSEDLTSLQSVFSLRLLNQLGYINPSSPLLPLLEASDTAKAMGFYTPAVEGEIEVVTKTAETVSHL